MRPIDSSHRKTLSGVIFIKIRWYLQKLAIYRTTQYIRIIDRDEKLKPKLGFLEMGKAKIEGRLSTKN